MNTPYSRPITPQRFVYHLSYCRNRKSILANGLKGASKNGKYIHYENAVFAHNSSDFSIEWYPFCMDQYEIDLPADDISSLSPLHVFWLAGLDVWRIDTTVYKGKWFLDEIGQKDFGIYCHNTKRGIVREAPELFAVTFGNIPVEAVKRVGFRGSKKQKNNAAKIYYCDYTAEEFLLEKNNWNNAA